MQVDFFRNKGFKSPTGYEKRSEMVAFVVSGNLFWKQGSSRSLSGLLRATKKHQSDTIDAFFMLDVLLSPTIACYGRQSAKATACAKLQRSKTADESHLISNMYLFRKDGKHTIYSLFTKFTFLFTIQITQSGKYQFRFAESILKGYEK